MKCDFCGIDPLTKPWWEFQCPDFTLVYSIASEQGGSSSIQNQYNGSWNACSDCSVLIFFVMETYSQDTVSDVQRELVKRGVDGSKRDIAAQGMEVPPDNYIEALVYETNAAFFQHQTGRYVLHA